MAASVFCPEPSTASCGFSHFASSTNAFSPTTCTPAPPAVDLVSLAKGLVQGYPKAGVLPTSSSQLRERPTTVGHRTPYTGGTTRSKYRRGDHRAAPSSDGKCQPHGPDHGSGSSRWNERDGFTQSSRFTTDSASLLSYLRISVLGSLPRSHTVANASSTSWVAEMKKKKTKISGVTLCSGCVTSSV